MPPPTPAQEMALAEQTIELLAAHLRREQGWHEKQVERYNEQASDMEKPVSIRRALVENAEWHSTRSIQIGSVLHASLKPYRALRFGMPGGDQSVT